MSIVIQVAVGESAINVGTQPDVTKVEIKITPQDKVDTNKPVKLQLAIHACFEIGKRSNNLNIKAIKYFVPIHALFCQK